MNNPAPPALAPWDGPFFMPARISSHFEMAAAPVENIGLCPPAYGGGMDKPAKAEPQDPAADVVAIVRAALADPIKRARLMEQARMYRALAAAGMIPPRSGAGRPITWQE